MVAPLFWEQEEQFDSDILRHRSLRANVYKSQYRKIGQIGMMCGWQWILNCKKIKNFLTNAIKYDIIHNVS